MDKTPATHDSPVKAYIYQPLLPGHIRLFRISKALKEVQLIHTAFHSAPAYAAVSYTWDDQPRDRDLLVDDSNLKVIKNIPVFLPRLVRSANTAYFWIDGICINQENGDEKAVQVPLMREIYSQCQECLIWLGNSTPESDMAIDTIPRIVHELELSGREQVWEMEGIAVTSPGVQNPVLWKGLLDIFSRPWFRRLWTFQEAVLPDNVMFLCGNKVIALPDIEPVAAPLLAHLTALQRSFPNAGWQSRNYFVGYLKLVRISGFRKASQSSKLYLETIKLMYFTRPWSATNRLDRIYGVLGLTDHSLQDHLVVDYEKTTAEVSKEVAEWFISRGEDLFLLNLASYRKREVEIGLPSWMPNFAQIGDHWCIGVFWHRFRTGMEYGPTHRKSAFMHSGELHVDGFRVDEVTQVIPFLKKANRTSAERIKDILEWEEACLVASRSVYGEEDVPEAHYTTMVSAICDKHLQPSRADYDLLKSFLRSLASEEVFPPDVEACHQHLAPQIRRLAQPKTFFCTQSGRIGLGLTDTQFGDHVCLFYNVFTPFMLRKNTEDGSKYQFISDSYTYGLMHGEVFKSEMRSQEQTFILV